MPRPSFRVLKLICSSILAKVMVSASWPRFKDRCFQASRLRFHGSQDTPGDPNFSELRPQMG